MDVVEFWFETTRPHTLEHLLGIIVVDRRSVKVSIALYVGRRLRNVASLAFITRSQILIAKEARVLVTLRTLLVVNLNVDVSNHVRLQREHLVGTLQDASGYELIVPSILPSLGPRDLRAGELLLELRLVVRRRALLHHHFLVGDDLW